MAVTTGIVYYTVSAADVDLLARIGAGRRVRLLPVAAGEEYAAAVTRSPVPDAPGDDTHADLMVFVNGTDPYFVRNAVKGTGQAGTWAATAQHPTQVG
jgi:hypothetical protein